MYIMYTYMYIHIASLMFEPAVLGADVACHGEDVRLVGEQDDAELLDIDEEEQEVRERALALPRADNKNTNRNNNIHHNKNTHCNIDANNHANQQ